MSDTRQSEIDEPSHQLIRCRRYVDQRRAGILTEEEFGLMFTITLIDSPEACLPDCVALIPSDALPAYVAFLREYLEANNFMPNPAPFLTNFSEESAERTKRMHEPKCRLIFDLVMKAGNLS